MAVLPVYITNRRKTHEVKEKADEIAEKLGEPNGHGSITNILEEILGLVRDQGRRTSRIESRLDRVERQLREVE